jgi:hypothetical protein
VFCRLARSPHFRPCLHLGSLGGNTRLDAARRRRPWHRIALPGVVATSGDPAHAGVTLEERKMPMKFSWAACQPNCNGGGSGWVNAVGIVTADTPGDFDELARGRQLGGATIVLDSSGGSVNAHQRTCHP